MVIQEPQQLMNQQHGLGWRFVLSTGSGLKDVAGVMKAVNAAGTVPMTIEPTIDALTRALDQHDEESR